MNKLQCLECGNYYKFITNTHLKKCCNLTPNQYKEKYPNSKLYKGYWLGKNRDIETNKKIGDANRGKKFTKDHKEKLSISHKESYKNGRINPMKDKKHSEESIQKIKDSNRGQKRSEETKQNMKIGNKKSYENGRIGPNKGKKFTDKHKQNQRISAIESYKNGRVHVKGMLGKKHSDITKQKQRISKIDEIEQKYGIIFPNYNSTACIFFDKLNKKMNWNGYHALNGGEFYIKELGYWVDFYEPTLNLVIEWDESYHNYQKEKDINRQNQIEKFLNCGFIRIKENENLLSILNNI